MKFVDLFCGMGTIRMGFEQAGHECVYSVEFDKHKREIYKVIFGREPDAGDIRAVRASDIPRSDCWCFGAPCQDFSVAGLRAGLGGERSGLVREVFRLVREKESAERPEWLLYENVKGMLSSNNGWDFAAIQAEMGQCGYDVQWQLLNSKNFGVPQNRERVYTLGHFRARGSRKIFPIGTDCEAVVINSGKIFEQNFKASIPPDVFYYRLRDSTASFYGGGDGSNIRFQAQNMCDCILFGNQTLFLCELKSHQGKSIPFSCVRENQIEQLTKAAKFPFIIPALVIFFPDVERCFMVHINDWNNLVDASKKKSANIAEIAQAGFEVGVKKLKTNFRYDVAKAMKDLTEDLNGK